MIHDQIQVEESSPYFCRQVADAPRPDFIRDRAYVCRWR